jgi:hypothetical protein
MSSVTGVNLPVAGTIALHHSSPREDGQDAAQMLADHGLNLATERARPLDGAGPLETLLSDPSPLDRLK